MEKVINVAQKNKLKDSTEERKGTCSNIHDKTYLEGKQF